MALTYPTAATHGDVLDLLRRSGPLTRRQIAGLTHLSRSTLVERLDALQRLQLVRPGARGASAQGRPPVSLEFDDSSRSLLVIDIGAAHAVIAVADLSARLHAVRRLDADLSQSPAVLLRRVVRSAQALVQRHGHAPNGLLGVGISFPGLAGAERGIVEAPAILAHWNNFPLGRQLEETFGCPAHLVNDAHAMAYGEYLTDGRRRTLLAVKVATGIGAGLVVDGRLHVGDSRGAGQFGHMRVPGLRDQCACGQVGCLATVASGRALVRRLEKHGIRTVGDIAVAAAEGHRPTVSHLQRAGEAVGNVLAGVATMVDPGAILLGGSLGRLPPLLDAVREAVGALTYARTAAGIHVGPTVLGDEAAVTGLAALVVDTELDATAVDRLVSSASRQATTPT